MSAAKKIGIAVSDHSVRLYLSAQTVQHLGGPGTKIRFLSKKIEEGFWEMSIREDKQSAYKINPHGSKDHPFKIELANPPYPLDRWPHTPVTKPVYIPVTYDEHPKRQITFKIRSDELSGKPDSKNPASALKSLANRMADKYAAPGETPQDTIKRVEAEVIKASPILSTQPQPQATPFRPAPEAKKALQPDEAPPAHQRLQMLLQGLNSILTTEINDIELFVEQIDEAGGVVKTIPLPVPSQMRIKGRRIREETFG